jgi:hypothetical protein
MTQSMPGGEGSRRSPQAAEKDTREAVLYARVSSKEQEQGYSIPAQLELLRSYAAQAEIRIVQEFVEADTAKTTGRPEFAAMVSYFKQHPACRILLVEKTDRLYRNFKDYIYHHRRIGCRCPPGEGEHPNREGLSVVGKVDARHQTPDGQELHRQLARRGREGPAHQSSARSVSIVRGAGVSQCSGVQKENG